MLADPDHDRLGFQPRAGLVDPEFQRLPAVVATGSDAHPLSQHRRDAQDIDRTSCIAVLAVSQLDHEGCRERREGVRHVHEAFADLDQIVPIKPRQILSDAFG